MDQRRNLVGLLLTMLTALRCLQGLAGPNPSPEVITVDSSDESDMSDMPWAPLEPELAAQPRVVEADEVTDMPVPVQGGADPLHEPPAVQDRPPRRGGHGPQQPGRPSRLTSSSTAFPGLRDHRAPGHDFTSSSSAWALPQQQAQQMMAPVQQGAAHAGGVHSHPQTAGPVTDERYATYRIGYAQTYDPASDPWHEDGMFPGRPGQHLPQQPQPYDPWEDDLDQPEPPLQQQPAPYRGQPRQAMQQRHQQPLPQATWVPHQMQHFQQPQPLPPQGGNGATGHLAPGAGQFQPPTMDPWGFIARHYASQGPLLPPDQWSHNALGLGRHRAGEPTASAAVHDNEDSTCATDTPCEEASPPQEEEDLEQEDDTGMVPSKRKQMTSSLTFPTMTSNGTAISRTPKMRTRNQQQQPQPPNQGRKPPSGPRDMVRREWRTKPKNQMLKNSA